MLVELIAYVDIRHRDPDVQEKLKPMNVSEADLNDGSNLWVMCINFVVPCLVFVLRDNMSDPKFNVLTLQGTEC